MSPASFTENGWVAGWIAVNLGMTLLNKSIFAHHRFPYPLVLSAWHMIVNAILAALIAPLIDSLDGDGQAGKPPKALKRSRPPKPTQAPQSTKSTKPTESAEPSKATGGVMLFSLLFAVNIALGNAASRLLSVQLTQVVRSLGPGMSMLLSLLLLGRRFPRAVVLSMVPVTLGVALATLGDLEFDGVGFALLVAGITCAALKGVYSSVLLGGATSMNALELLQRMCPLAAVHMLVMAAGLGELQALWHSWADVPVWTLVVVGSTGVVAFLNNLANFMTLKTTGSPVTLAVAGNLKQALAIGLAFPIFGTPISSVNLAGIVVTLAGGLAYNVANLKAKAKAKGE